MQKSKNAAAHISGGESYPCLSGKAEFHQIKDSVWVIVSVTGLPKNSTGFYALHIHNGESCEGEGFSMTEGHYNPDGNAHPTHRGDLPPLLSSNGKAYMAVMTDRFTVDEIIGKTVVIHSEADDFTSQPAGNSGYKIACGVIQ